MSSDSINDKNISIEELEKLLFNLKNRSKNTRQENPNLGLSFNLN